MSEDHKQQLESQLWNIANTLRGKMGADDFRDYILGFIFYKYLSERMHLFADKILKNDGITFDAIDESSAEGKEMLDAIQEEAIGRLGYFLKPSELFSRDLHVTLLRLLGLDDNKLTYFHAGRYKQLSQFGGQVIKELIA
tara:strand:+ start:111 stop:530 length:420 start_codon:yes stop_codon:yes gene_type:complete